MSIHIVVIVCLVSGYITENVFSNCEKWVFLIRVFSYWRFRVVIVGIVSVYNYEKWVFPIGVFSRWRFRVFSIRLSYRIGVCEFFSIRVCESFWREVRCRPRIYCLLWWRPVYPFFHMVDNLWFILLFFGSSTLTICVFIIYYLFKTWQRNIRILCVKILPNGIRALIRWPLEVYGEDRTSCLHWQNG